MVDQLKGTNKHPLKACASFPHAFKLADSSSSSLPPATSIPPRTTRSLDAAYAFWLVDQLKGTNTHPLKACASFRRHAHALNSLDFSSR